MRAILKIGTALLILFLSACSGGGGGGSGGSRGSSQRPSTGFRVLHANIDLAPLDVYRAGDTSMLGSVSFAGSSGYFSSGGQDQAVTLTTAHVPSELVASIVVPLAPGAVKSVLVYGDAGAFGLKTAVIDDVLPQRDQSSALIRVVHGAVGASSVSAEAGTAVITGNTSFGSASNYASVPAGAVTVTARRNADGSIIFSSTPTLEAGKAYTLLLSGDVGYLASGSLLSDG